jgi:Gram-negative bacterial TonB protein C-terminal
MTFRLPIVTLGMVLCHQAIFAVAQDARPLTVSEKTMAALLLSYETPSLSTPPLKERCSNALAIVRVFVDADGKVSNADYISGFSDLKEPALAAVRRWSYKPYFVGGKPVPVQTQASIFYLGDGEAMPTYVPDGKGGTKVGNMLPLPSGCGPGPQIKKRPN